MVSVKFHTISGSLDDLIKNITKDVDLIIEGGSGSSIYPCNYFKKLGFDKPYVRTDLTYVGEAFEPNIFKSKEYKMDVEWWPYDGNCFIAEEIKPIVKKFNSKKPLFVTHNALSNALFSKQMTPWDKKSQRDRIPISTAVDVLSEIYDVQFHINPAGIATIVPKKFVEKHKDKLKNVPQEEFYDSIVALKGGGTFGFFNFQPFIEKSAELGWEFFLLEEHPNHMLMKK